MGDLRTILRELFFGVLVAYIAARLLDLHALLYAWLLPRVLRVRDWLLGRGGDVTLTLGSQHIAVSSGWTGPPSAPTSFTLS